ncbi:hypothetical protein [Streptococcus sciuri]|uniref:Uncharacterized protein n=1 Tax=Streptococcus sciuri TaxID=2973939 RepID=A0ABT2F7H6_9STRE|nr:hypothetical protein [Streptococcus sciuri]MCS4488417.1 hypothetical protein [Streptococcus sciuri]
MVKRYRFYVLFIVVISRFIWFAITGRSPLTDFIGTVFLGTIALVISQKAFKKMK